MIDQQLLPLDRTDGLELGECLEAFAFSYLAYYSDQALTIPQLLSFQRAWGYSSIKLLPQINSTTPGWIMVSYVTPYAVKLIIAVRGVDSVGSFFQTAIGTASTAVGSEPGRVYLDFFTCATNLYTAITTNSDYIGLT